MRGYKHASVVDAIREAGGQIYAITSEPQTLAHSAQEGWETGFEHVGDPHHEISGQCAERGWISLFNCEFSRDFASELSWVSHPKGFFQPGVLALNATSRLLYRWRCRPTRKNVGGAAVRPTASHVWRSVQSALSEPADAPDVAYDDAPEFDGPGLPWPLFVSLLIANGWFIKPLPFDELAGGPRIETRLRNAFLRILLFVAAWALAFASLPTWLPALALAAWVVKITPGVRLINNSFQNVGPEENPL